MVAVKEKFPHLADGNIDLDAWLQKVEEKFHLKDIQLIKRSAFFAEKINKGLTLFYGQPCIEHGLEIAEIILDLNLNQEAVAAAILSSTISNTNTSVETIKAEFGETVAKLVSGISQMEVINKFARMKQRDPIQIDRLRKTFLAMASDIHVVLIKLAERTSLLRGIKNIHGASRKLLAEETMDIYAPLANRLGIGQLKWELEDLAFHYIDPETYKNIAKFLAERRKDREHRIHEIITKIREKLAASNIQANTSGRAKHIYSIYLKLRSKHLDLKDIFDYSAVRIIVPTLPDCYTTLGIVHSLWEHIPEEFDDYISHPKLNGYRSIHTAVIGPDGKNMEIQIRTYEMHEQAEHGVAAHWIYKENKQQTSSYEAKITYLRQLLAWHRELTIEKKILNSSGPVIEDRIYVFTPEGDIIDLPQGSTPLDFAYHIHSELGHHCRGAKINGHIVPLTYSLRTGDKVEIIAIKEGSPSRDWLNKEFKYITTARARSKVAQWFRQQDIAEYIANGKERVEREFNRLGIQPNLQKLALHFNFKDDNSFFAAVGHGIIRLTQITQVVLAEEHRSAVAAHHVITNKKFSPPKDRYIIGAYDLLTRIALCCKPIPGDDIIGFITQGRGVSIHRKKCLNLSHLIKEKTHRLLDVSWEHKQQDSYLVDLQIRGLGREEFLKDLTHILSNTTLKISIVNLNSNISAKNNMISITLTLQINGLMQLQKLLTILQQIPNLIDIKRICE